MDAKPRLFVDTNIAQDVVQLREGYGASLELFSLARANHVILGISPIIALNLVYLNRKISDATSRVQKLLAPTTAVPITSELLDEAYLLAHCPDLEDEVQYLSAVQFKAEAIITRNVRDFQRGDIPAMTPEDYFEQAMQAV